MLTSILIDVDGTLINTKNIFYASLNETLRKYNIAETRDSRLFGMSVDQTLRALGVARTESIKDDWERLFSEMSMSAGFYDNIPEMVKALSFKNMKVIIITSRSHSTADPICDSSVLSPYISGCIAAEDTTEHKPDPAPILKAIDVYKLDKEKTLYIGDTLQDYQAASEAFIPFALAGWNTDAKIPGDALVLREPMDIIPLIEEGRL